MIDYYKAIDTETGLMLPKAELYDGVKGTEVIDGEDVGSRLFRGSFLFT